MPIIKSAKKRVKVAAKANARNTRTRRSMREAIKAFNQALESGKSAEIAKFQREAISAIDTATKKHVIHKNKAAHSKARLAKQVKSAGIKTDKPVTRTRKSATKKKNISSQTRK